jgi:hypothetical protein
VAPPFLTSALDLGEWSASPPLPLTTGETALLTPCAGWLGGLQGRFGRYGEEKIILPVPGIGPQPEEFYLLG